jgi:hypothetical protein
MDAFSTWRLPIPRQVDDLFSISGVPTEQAVLRLTRDLGPLGVDDVDRAEAEKSRV